MGLRLERILTSMPIESVSPFSAFVLDLGCFELGDASVATESMDVSPSWSAGTGADIVPRSDGPDIDVVLLRGMMCVGDSPERKVRRALGGLYSPREI